MQTPKLLTCTKAVLFPQPISRAVLHFYLFLLFLAFTYCLFTWPIIAKDTDLWYHLNAGRYIWEHQAIPQDSFFSFLSPPREWVNYYWLFQALVYKIYAFFGYTGLVFLRAMIYLATLGIIFLFLFFRQEERSSFPYLLAVFGLCCIHFWSRFELLRPHGLSYFFIACFLYTLEFHPQKAWILPLIAIVWVNVHGIEFPVMILITLSYLSEFWVSRWRSGISIRRHEISYLVSLATVLGTVYLTPHRSNLISVPLVSTDLASQYILELMPIPLQSLFSFNFSGLCPDYPTSFNLLFISIGVAMVRSLGQKKIRISHFVLLAGGFFLLTKGLRFANEFILLALPFLRFPLFRLSTSDLRQGKKLLEFALVALFLFFPFFHLANHFYYRPQYPLSTKNLPEGVVKFLNHISAGGSILNNPNQGGYLQWMLHPKYKIFMDLQVPFLFSDEDYFTVRNAFHDEAVLEKIIQQFHPSFISVPLPMKWFPAYMKKHPGYVLVFFDHVDALYVNRVHFPDVASKYEIRQINPFDLPQDSVEPFSLDLSPNGVRDSMMNLLSIDPGCFLKNQIMATAFNKEGGYRQAIPYAEVLIQRFPENPMGYWLKAEALKGMGLHAEALSFFQKAVERSQEAGKPKLYNKMAYIYAERQDYSRAYDYYRKGVQIFSPETNSQDLWNLSSAALLSGRTQEGVRFLIMAHRKVHPNDIQLKEKIESQLLRLGIPPEKGISSFIPEDEAPGIIQKEEPFPERERG